MAEFPYLNGYPKPGEDKLELRKSERFLLEVSKNDSMWTVHVYNYTATNESMGVPLIKIEGFWLKRTVKKALRLEAQFRKANSEDSMLEWAAKRPQGRLSLESTQK